MVITYSAGRCTGGLFDVAEVVPFGSFEGTAAKGV